MQNNLIVATILSAVLLAVSPFQAVAADTFYELFQLAKKNDSMVTRAEARLSMVKAESGIVRSNLLPRLDASLGVSHITQTIDNYNRDPSRTGSVMGYNYAVMARMNALHVPTLLNLTAVDSGIRAEEAGVRMARQDLVVRFADAYYGLLKARQDYQIAQKEIERVKQVLDQSQAFLEKGTGDIIAVYEAKARFDGVTADMSRYEGNLRLAEQKLSTLVGRQVTEVVDNVPLAAAVKQPQELSWWLDTMEKNDPVIRQGIEGLERSSKELKAVKSEHLPVVQASGGYTSSKGSVFLPEVETKQWYAGVSISIPIFSGGETTAKVQRAVASESERKGMLEELRKQRRENLKQSYYNLVYNIALVKANEKRVSSAEMQLNAVNKGRSIGTRSATDVLNAEQAYSVALKDYRNALYDNEVRNILLKNAAGVLDDEDPAPGVPGKQPEMQPAQSAQQQPVVAAQPQQPVGASVGVLLMGAAPSLQPVFYQGPDQKNRRTAGCDMLTLHAAKGQKTLETPVVVLDKQDNWLKVACSTAEDSSWILMQKEWRYLIWKEYLKSRKIRLLAGLKKEQYHIYDSSEKEIVAVMTPQDQIEVESIIEDWALVKLGKSQIGWLRWKDASGSLLVSVL